MRLLVPGGSDLPLVRTLSRAGYRALLEGGVRVFEWNGPMVHAKTAVADGCWARVGSTNLNLQSWVGNWELDVAVEDAVRPGDGGMFEADLAHATEVLLDATHRRRIRAAVAGPRHPPPRRPVPGVARAPPPRRCAHPARRGRGPAHRPHGRRRAHGQPAARGRRRLPSLVIGGACSSALVGALGAWWPALLAYPLAAAALWLGVMLLVGGWRAARAGGPAEPAGDTGWYTEQLARQPVSGQAPGIRRKDCIVKPGIHPEYHEVTAHCACGATWTDAVDQ